METIHFAFALGNLFPDGSVSNLQIRRVRRASRGRRPPPTPWTPSTETSSSRRDDPSPPRAGRRTLPI